MKYKTIYGVEDEFATASLIELLLVEISHFYSFLTFRDLWIGLSKGKYTPPDVFLLDVILNEGDEDVQTGIEAARKLRADERFANIPIIFYTALTYEELGDIVNEPEVYHIQKTGGIANMLSQINQVFGVDLNDAARLIVRPSSQEE